LIGSHIADGLVREGASEIRIYDDFSRGTLRNLEWARANGNLRIIEASVTDRLSLAKACEGVDTLFHLAAIRITRCAQDPLLAHEILGTGTINVFDAAVKAGVRKVVASSSASVYGQADVFPIREDHHPYNNDTIYGALKCYLEGAAKAYHQTHGLAYVALRYFNVYGPRMDAEGKYTEVMIRWMERCAQGEAPIIFGDGKQTMDFVYVEDIARANLLAAKAGITQGAYNVARGEETSLRDLAIGISRAMGCEREPECAPERSVSPVRRRLADTQAALRDLGFRAEIPLDEGLRRLVAWWTSLKNSSQQP
jgi:UDP-glucose 4-epimerase